jgi:ATP-dependent Clp protease ATP-binding subunit ClpX
MGPRNAFCSFCRKSYREVGPLVEGPGDVYICGDCVELCQSIIQQEKRRRGLIAGPLSHIPAAEHIEATLSWYGCGPQKANRILSALVHAHYERVRQGQRQAEPAILLLCPSRSSKVFLSRVLAHTVDVPFGYGDAQALGERASDDPRLKSPLLQLLQAADFDIEAAERGIVYVEGLDRQDVQEPIRELLEATVYNVPPPGPKHPGQRTIKINTNNILFICGGSFAGLDHRLAGRRPDDEQPVTTEDLITRGVTPQVVHRFRAVAAIDPVSEETLVRLLSGEELKRLSDDGG